jgi:predicted NUDIX family NTP pyrophosphohydrolase
LVNANLEDGIAAVRAMVAIGHSARYGGDWVNVNEVEGDLAHSSLKRSNLTTAWPYLSRSRELERSAFGLESID